ncbi:hypothetical protein ACIOEW_15210 [Streptomyces sp. NPDC087901]|uniref:hypothetical protein n=1 Tax=Streptomyces sp. NPDC087901 TaxID=3365818 RepID=UPI003818EDA4
MPRRRRRAVPGATTHFSDPATRRKLVAEQPRLPLSYYEQDIPVPAGWDDHPCSYLLFGPPYEEVAADARARGWRVAHLPGEHLHQTIDPVGTTRLLLELTVGADRPPGGLTSADR